MEQSKRLDSKESANINPGTESVKNADTNLRQLVCFRLESEDFGVNIESVQEINRMVAITKIPQAPVFVEGVINLRGQIIPVIDLRTRFGFSRIEEKSKENRIVVVETQAVTVGLVVDAVTEVLRLSNDKIEETPDITSNVEAQYIEGVAMLDERLLILLDTDKIFSSDEMAKMETVASA